VYNSFEILIFVSSISNIQKQYSILSEKVKITMVKYIDQKESILTGLKDLSNLSLKIKEKKKTKI
jgi:hypothetical protein